MIKQLLKRFINNLHITPDLTDEEYMRIAKRLGKNGMRLEE